MRGWTCGPSTRMDVNALLRRVPAWPLYPLGLLPMVWLWGLALTGRLGPEPVNALIRELGMWGLWFLIASLAVTPLRRFAGVNLIRYRRALGLLAFFYVAMHFGVWAVLDLRDLGRVAEEIAKRPYVTIGMAGFVAMLPLAVTSTDRAIRRMGPVAWRRLHRLAYVAGGAGVLHYIWLVKGWPLEPFVYAGVVAGLLAARWVPRRQATAARG